MKLPSGVNGVGFGPCTPAFTPFGSVQIGDPASVSMTLSASGTGNDGTRYVPPGENRALHSGIGMHSARAEVLRHMGELFMSNIDGGVETLIVIPQEGKKSPWRVSDIPVSGFMLDDFARRAAVARGMDMEPYRMLAVLVAARLAHRRRR